MLLPDSIKPEYCVYYLSSRVLKALLDRSTSPGFFELYEYLKTKDAACRDLSFRSYLLCLDFLYLIDAAAVNDQGEIRLCSSAE